MPRHRKRKKQAQRAKITGTASTSPASMAKPAEHTELGVAEMASRTIELREEQLVTRKQVVEAGVVEVRTEVLSEQRSLEVVVAREEVFVERQPVDRRPANRPLGIQEVLADIPEYGQQVSLQARPIVTRELIVGRETVQEIGRVSATLRREEASLESSDSGGPGGER